MIRFGWFCFIVVFLNDYFAVYLAILQHLSILHNHLFKGPTENGKEEWVGIIVQRFYILAEDARRQRCMLVGHGLWRLGL